MFEYVSVSSNQEHINRHFADSLVPGSKFLPMSEDKKLSLIDIVDLRLAETFQGFLDNHQAPSRTVFQIEFDHNIGTNVLVEIPADEQEQFTTVIRDAGTPHEANVKIRESEDIPQTNTVTVIAGPYGPSGKWGIYTMFPGLEAPPFPQPERQSPEAFQSNTAFWNTHGFLATKAEMLASTAREPRSITATVPAPRNE